MLRERSRKGEVVILLELTSKEWQRKGEVTILLELIVKGMGQERRADIVRTDQKEIAKEGNGCNNAGTDH